MPNNDYGLIHGAFGDVYTVRDDNYDYVDATANIRDMDELIAQPLRTGGSS